jgi:hypothetical protein
MARRRTRENSPIRFENLDGSPASSQQLDDEFVDPLDAEPGEGGAEEEDDADPRADDPFAEDTLEDEDDGKDELAADAEQDDDEGGEDEDEDEKVTDPELRKVIARQQEQIDELTRDRSLTRQQLEEANKVLYERRAKEVDDGIASTRATLKSAIEDGDTDRQVELQERLAELHATKRELGAIKERGDRAQSDRPERQAAPQAASQMPVVQAQTPAAERWLKGRSWVNNPAYAEQNRELIRMAGVLVQDGYDPQADDYYQELERRMRRKHPGLFGNGRGGPVRRPDRQAVGRVSRDDPPQLRRNGKRTVRLSAEDVKTMQRFSLNPRDADHIREFLRNKEA